MSSFLMKFDNSTGLFKVHIIQFILANCLRADHLLYFSQGPTFALCHLKCSDLCIQNAKLEKKVVSIVECFSVIFFKVVCFYFICINVCLHVNVYMMCMQWQWTHTRRGHGSLGNESQVVVIYHVSAANQTRVLCKSNTCY